MRINFLYFSSNGKRGGASGKGQSIERHKALKCVDILQHRAHSVFEMYPTGLVNPSENHAPLHVGFACRIFATYLGHLLHISCNHNSRRSEMITSSKGKRQRDLFGEGVGIKSSVFCTSSDRQ
jgi:hypothetical protein